LPQRAFSAAVLAADDYIFSKITFYFTKRAPMRKQLYLSKTREAFLKKLHYVSVQITTFLIEL
ncbi:MAG: hypothetical protein K5769_08400, partial [Pseudobutyrivibrio sp.]|nr:hypothetical protein [Pseudobutyrivibrio sp.]